MLLIVAVSLLFLLFILLLHYSQHFQCQCRRKSTVILASNQPRMSIVQSAQLHMNLLASTNCCMKCCCNLLPIAEFDFFPISFLYYILFMTILYVLITATQILDYYHNNNKVTIADLIFKNTLNHSSLFSKIHTINALNIMDVILMYCVIILSVWISLFSFYRYQTSLISTKTLQSITTKKLFKKFFIFAFIYCVIFMVQIHLYYWLFPIVIILFCSFNWYCTYKFAAMLIERYKLFIDLNKDLSNANEEILRSVRVTRYTSLICCILESINLSLFTIIYHTNIIYYLPILWTLSCFMVSFNFIRNRRFLMLQIFKCQQFSCCIYIHSKMMTHNRTLHVTPLNPINVDTTQQNNLKTVEKTTLNRNKSDSNDRYMLQTDSDERKVRQIWEKDEKVIMKPKIKIRTKNSKSCSLFEIKENVANSPLHLSNLKRTSSEPISPVNHEELKQETPDTFIESTHSSDSVFKTPKFKKTKNSKSLEYYAQQDIKCDESEIKPLQFTSSAPGKVNNDVISSNVWIAPKISSIEPIKIYKTQSKSKTVSFRLPEIETEYNPPIINAIPKHKALELLGITPTPSPMPILRTQSGSRSETLSRLKALARIKKQSSQTQSKSNKSESIKIIYRTMESTDNNSDNEHSTPVTPTPAALSIRMMQLNENELSHALENDNNNNNGFGFNETKENEMPQFKLAMKSVKSHSAPNHKEIDDKSVDEMFLSLNILANYGFCSRESINSVKQLNEYQHTINEKSKVLEFNSTKQLTKSQTPF